MRVLVLGRGAVAKALTSVYSGSTDYWLVKDDLPDERFDMVVNAMEAVPGHLRMEVDREFFEWVERTEQPRGIYMSGSDAYPGHLREQTYRLKESDVDPDELNSPGSALGWALLHGEALASASPAHMTIFRPFEMYGPGTTGVFTELVEMVKRREDPFVMPSTDILDFIHIFDVINAINLRRHIRPHVVANICSGQPTSLVGLAGTMFTAAGWRPKTFVAEMQGSRFTVGDPLRMVANWIPRIALADEISQEIP